MIADVEKQSERSKASSKRKNLIKSTRKEERKKSDKFAEKITTINTNMTEGKGQETKANKESIGFDSQQSSSK